MPAVIHACRGCCGPGGRLLVVSRVSTVRYTRQLKTRPMALLLQSNLASVTLARSANFTSPSTVKIPSGSCELRGFCLEGGMLS